MVTFLLDGGVDIDVLSRESMTALHFGAIGANVAMVKVRSEFRAWPMALSHFFSCSRCPRRIPCHSFQMLFERGADISARNSNRNSILSYTGAACVCVCVELLLD